MRRRSSALSDIVLPSGWSAAPLSEVAELCPPRPLRRGAEAPFVEMAAVDAVLPGLKAVGSRRYLGTGARFRNGDVLLARISPCFENGKAALVRELPPGETGFGSTELTVLGPRRTTPEYLYYLLKCEEVRRPLSARRAGTSRRQRIQAAAWAEVVVPVPPPAEQLRITAVLGAVDAAIAATQAVAEQLRRLRGALARDLFARPYPARRGAELFTLAGGRSPNDVALDPVGDTLFLKVEDLGRPENRRDIREAALRFLTGRNPGIRAFGPGHLVFPKRGGAIVKNRVRVLARAAAVDPNLMVLAPGPSLDPHYFAEALRHLGLSSFADDAGVPQINHKHLYPAIFPAPPLEAQRSIRAALGALDDRLEAEEARGRGLLALRAALLSGLLTGALRYVSEEVGR